MPLMMICVTSNPQTQVQMMIRIDFSLMHLPVGWGGSAPCVLFWGAVWRAGSPLGHVLLTENGKARKTNGNTRYPLMSRLEVGTPSPPSSSVGQSKPRGQVFHQRGQGSLLFLCKFKEREQILSHNDFFCCKLHGENVQWSNK